jgi:hypothetical protein
MSKGVLPHVLIRLWNQAAKVLTRTDDYDDELFNLMKNIKPSTRLQLTDEHTEGCVQIPTTEKEPDIERLITQAGMTC